MFSILHKLMIADRSLKLDEETRPLAKRGLEHRTVHAVLWRYSQVALMAKAGLRSYFSD